MREWHMSRMTHYAHDAHADRSYCGIGLRIMRPGPHPSGQTCLRCAAVRFETVYPEEAICD